MKVAIERIDRVVHVEELHGDGIVVQSELVETDIYKVHYILLLSNGDTAEDYIRVNSNEPITFENGEQTVKDVLRDSVSEEAHNET